MECPDARELAESYLSGELPPETNREYARHLESCPECRADVAGRRAIRDRLRAAVLRADALRPRPDFAQELSARLRPRATIVNRRELLRSWWPAAAGVVLAAGGGLYLWDSRSRSSLAALARDAAGDHQHCAVVFSLAERPIRLEEAGQRYGAPYAALATFEAPRLDLPLQELDRHACVYEGRRFGHVVFRYDGVVTSILVTVADPPSATRLEPGDGAFQIAAFPAGRFAGFVVAELDSQRVLRLADAFAGPLARHLA